MGNVEVKESGKLEDKPALARMLDLLKNPFKGVMVFVRGKDRKSFVFDGGKPMLSNTLLQEGMFGKILIEKNLVTSDEFKKIKEIEATGKTFFQSVKEVMDPGKFEDAVLSSWIEDLSVVFGWDVGQFANVEFLPKDVVKVETQHPLSYYYFRALCSKHAKRKTTKFSPNARFEINSAPETFASLADLHFSEIEQKIYDSLKSSKTIKQLVQELASTQEVIAPVIFSLRDLSLVRADSDPRKRQVAIPVPSMPQPQTQQDSKAQDTEYFAKLGKMDEMDHFQLLGVPTSATTKDIQDKYFSLAKKYHPDRVKNIPGVQLKEAEKLFTRITEAYNTLSNPQLRKEYEMHSSHQAVEHEKLMQRIIDSENLYLEGKALLTKNLFKEAVDKIKQAITLYDQEPEYLVSLGWALFRSGVKDSNPSRIQESKKILMDAHGKNYHMPDVTYYLGMIFKQENKLDQARKYFLQCISLEPGYALANSELRAIEKKMETGKKK